MPVYKVDYTLEEWHSCEIEADIWEEARDKFWRNDYDTETDKLTGLEIQDSVEIEEAN